MIGALLALALLHSPHDVLSAWAISPDFARDRTLYVAASRFKLLLRSTDGGESFHTVVRGLDTADVRQLAISPAFGTDRTLYCAEAEGLYVSTDAGDRWMRLEAPPAAERANVLALSPSFGGDGVVVVAASEGGLFRSDDRGASWEAAPTPDGVGPLVALAFAPDGGRLFASDGAVILATDDRGASWTRIPAPAGARVAHLLPEPGGDALWIATAGQGVHRTGDGGASWEPLVEGLTDPVVTHLARGGATVFAATRKDGIFRRGPGDEAWRPHREGLRERSPQSAVHYFATLPSPAWPKERTMYAVTFEGLHVSVDGTPWRHLDVLPGSIVRNLALSPAYADDGTLWISSYGHGLQRSTDRGRSFERVHAGAWDFPDLVGAAPSYADDGTLMAGIPFALLMTDAETERWRVVRRGQSGFGRMAAFAPDYAESGLVFVATTLPSDPTWRGFLRSPDRGASWEPVGPPIVYEVAFSPHWSADGRAWAATPTGLFATRDRGRTWEAVASCPVPAANDVAAAAGADGAVRLLVAAPSRPDAGVFVSPDGGASWVPAEGGAAGHRVVHVAFADGGPRAFAGTHDAGVLVSEDGGATWSPTGDGPRSVLCMAVSATYATDRTVAAGGYEGLWLSDDGGASWRLAAPDDGR